MAIISLMLVLMAGCAASQATARKDQAATATTAASGDGSSMAAAVIIHSDNEMDGIAQEYRWIEKHYPGYQRGSQSLLFNAGRAYDLLEFKDADGKGHSVYFDITSFYGKM